MSTPTKPAPQPGPPPVETESPIVEVNPDPGMSQIIERGGELDGETR